MEKIKKLAPRFGLLAVMVGLVLCGLSSAQKTVPSVVKRSKTETMLKEISAKYTRPVSTELAFVVPYSGKEMESIGVFVIEAEGAVVVMVDVAPEKEVDLTQAVMRKLLEYNMNADYIKVGIDDDGMIRIQREQDLGSMNSSVLQKLMDQAAAGANEVTAILAPVRKKAAAK